MQIFRSKIDLWLIVVIIASLLLPIIIAWVEPSALTIAALTTITMFLLTGWLFWATRYVVQNNALTIYTGFGKVCIPIESIKSVTPSRNVLASPALSLDRLEISYGKNQSILISPKDKSEFLTAINKD